MKTLSEMAQHLEAEKGFSPMNFINDSYICQVCGDTFDSQEHPPTWRPDVTQRESAGNVCPGCLHTHETLVAEAEAILATPEPQQPATQLSLPGEPQPGQITDAKKAVAFIMAGNAYFTVRSLKTGTRYTFRVAKPRWAREEGRSMWYVSLLNGPDNTANYTYLGTLVGPNDYRHSRKSVATKDAPSVMAFAWLMARLAVGHFPANVELWHEGRCGRCGRLLTVPESVAAGIGPECAGKVGR